MLYPISSAITMIRDAGNCHTNCMLSFVATRHNIVGDFDLKENAFACWYGQQFFKMWLGDEFLTDEKEEVTSVVEIISIISKDGVYYIDFDGNEFHHFVLITQNNSIWYAGTYGGVDNLTVKAFNKEDFLRSLERALLQNSLSDYNYIFNITNPSITSVDFTCMQIMKSPRYTSDDRLKPKIKK